jgi:hypothetical protein
MVVNQGAAMRPTTKFVLSTCAAVTIAQGHGAAVADPGATGDQEPPTTDPTVPDAPPPDPNQPPVVPETAPPPEPSTPEPAIPPDRYPPPAVEPATPVVMAPVLVERDPYSYAWREEGLQSGIGVSATLGGGVVGFTEETMRDTTSSVGGLWDLRVTIGSHIPLGLDISYLGSATNVDGLPTGESGTLIGTTLEGALRFNMLPHYAWNPYIFAGVGWQRYDVTEANVSLSDAGMNDQDDLLEFPMGLGLAYRMGGLVADLRGTFRATTDEDLVLENPTSPTSDDFARLHTWQASAAIGYEF